MRFICLTIVACCAVAGRATPAGAEKRVALVIGNADYRIGPLANPLNDASAVAEAFDKRLKFDKVILRKNLGAEAFPKDAFIKRVGPSMLRGVPIVFGYNVRSDTPEDTVYKMVKGFFDKRDELATLEPGFAPLAKDFIGLQTAGINANPKIPVHAGLARFLKDHRAWNDRWRVSTGAPAARR